jgi:hypothetical protein
MAGYTIAAKDTIISGSFSALLCWKHGDDELEPITTSRMRGLIEAVRHGTIPQGIVSAAFRSGKGGQTFFVEYRLGFSTADLCFLLHRIGGMEGLEQQQSSASHRSMWWSCCWSQWLGWRSCPTSPPSERGERLCRGDANACIYMLYLCDGRMVRLNGRQIRTEIEH